MDDVKVRLTFERPSRLPRILIGFSLVSLVAYASASPRGAAELTKLAAGTLFDIAAACGDFLAHLTS